MNKLFFLLCGLTIFSNISIGQKIVLIDKETRKNITNDSILIQSKDNGGWMGAESLDLGILIKYTDTGIAEIGAKKIEYESFPKTVSHTICFAGQCYDVPVFISPMHVNIDSNTKDSSFLAHFLFENKTHVRGINHVKYVFYNVNKSSDSSFVFVTYNTMVNFSSINSLRSNNTFAYYNGTDKIELSPFFQRTDDLTFYDYKGQILPLKFNYDVIPYALDVSSLNKGFYLLKSRDFIQKIILD